MSRQKWNLNTIYISERLKACLRPVSDCALTTVVAPMGYGKTTAINWFLDEQGKMDVLCLIRISVYSDNLAIFWKVCRRLLNGRVLIFWGIMRVRRTLREPDC